ncbi:MAG: DUF1786 family protein [Candidatus Wallbacteria bacterium]
MSKILGIDIGMGTTDVFLYDTSKNIENCIKFVIPTPSRRYRSLLKKINFTGSEKIHISGDTIGGGPLAHDLIKLAEKNKAEIIIDRKAAYTIRNDISEVKGFGIKISDELPADSPALKSAGGLDFNGIKNSFSVRDNDIYMNFSEIELPFLINFFENAGEDMRLFDGICVCAQDHGICPKEISDRLNRFSEFKKILEGAKTPSPYSFCFKKGMVPEVFYRLKSVEERVNAFMPDLPAIIMDSSPAALLGCFAFIEEYAGLYKKNLDEPYLMVNMGNNHAIFVVVEKEKILAFYEHHSWVYDEMPAKLEEHIKRFCDGRLPSEEIFDDEGNGAIYFEPPGFKNVKNIIVTGPNRNIFMRTNLNVYYSSVGGDMMMSGPIGMAKAFQRLYPEASIQEN